MKKALIPVLVLLVIIGFYFLKPLLISDTTSLPKKIDFNNHIRPILSDKCFACHGPDAKTRKADLRLDTKEGAFAPLKDYDDKYAVVPGDPLASEMIYRIFAEDTSEIMPPPKFKLTLTTREKELIKKWVEQGAEYKPHWSFVPPEKADVPDVKNKKWGVNEIDYFVLAKLEEMALEPNEEAGKEYLLKRVAFDLTGLPPSLEMQERFLQDNSENAYEKIVDELLANEHYGEKMAIHWLDVARYADSHGYQDDGLRTMWPWRDWVIHAFNENYPYDQFVTWQLAGDLIPDKTKETILATGFNRNHKITQEGGVIDEEYRIEYVTDRTNTFGKTFLGLTYECAKCHSHKYDPISQQEYFGTFAFFDKVPEKGLVGTIDAHFADPPNIRITDEVVKNELPFINKKDTAYVEVMVMKDSVGIRDTHILTRGNYDAKAEVVTFGTPKAILPFDTTQFQQNRLGLAKWLLDEKNPLPARVFVNRIWQEIFGRGLVKTSGDLGLQGEFPSHPELLDWLAVDFREKGWDIKRLVKNIVMSATYRQSARVTEKKLKTDPENIYLSRSSRLRLGAEVIKDHVMASSGLYNPEIGGPSVKPYQPEGLWNAATSGRGTLQRYFQDHGSDLYRRGMYTFIKRTVPPPTMLVFDASNRDQCEIKRVKTSTPLQALVMMNDPHVLEASRVMAEELMLEESAADEKMSVAFRRILCRKMKEEERAVFQQYYQESLEHFKANPDKAGEFIQAGEFKHLNNGEINAVAALMQVIHTMYNMEEAITKS
ncbi:MAG: PSD1 and planctomycete cytochrome C domain-containing protein [Cyclobacteriaceae bacterium]|nr:PSD1 and planctomycete cytochrome C domain-containing protein [Cyclobacteriaceae bacterium]